MNNADIFFGGVSNAGEGLPPMPKNIGHCGRLAGHHMPAQKLITITSAVASGGVVTVQAAGHGLDVGTTGTTRISGANEPVFNGAHTYQVVSASELTFDIASGSPNSATGTLSACVDVFEGDYYSLPERFYNYSSGELFKIKRFGARGNERWSVDVVDDERDQFLGVSMFPDGDLAICYVNMTGNIQDLHVYVAKINKSTGSRTIVSTVMSTFGGSSEKTFPAREWYEEFPLITFHGRESTEIYTSAFHDMTRSVFEVLEPDYFYLSGTSYVNSRGSSQIPDNAEVTFNSYTHLSADYVRDIATTLPLGFPVQYSSKDRRVRLGKIYSAPSAGVDLSGFKFFSIARGGVGTVGFIANDPTQHCVLYRAGEFKSGAVPWLSLTEFSEEPLKVYSLGDFVLLSACPTHSISSTIKNTLVLGSSFMARSDFDDWLNALCDHLGLPE